MTARRSPAAAFAALPRPVRAGLWMTAAAMMLAGMIAIIRHVFESYGIHPFEIAFFRNLFGLAFMLPWLMRVGMGGLRTQRLGLYTLRAAFGLVAMMTWFWAVSQMPIAQAVALSFTAPLFGTVLAALVLRETVRLRRWTATAVGFMGALVILRPGIEGVTLPAAVVLASALTIAMAMTTVKALSRTEPASAIVIYMVIFLTPLSLMFALPVWTTPTWEALGWMVAMGGLATLGHQCLTRAFQTDDATVVLPFDYTRLIWAEMLGIWVFGEVSDLWTWVGGGIIAAAAIYIAHREAVTGRTAPPPTRIDT